MSGARAFSLSVSRNHSLFDSIRPDGSETCPGWHHCQIITIYYINLCAQRANVMTAR
jgi:hypothetical protein